MQIVNIPLRAGVRDSAKALTERENSVSAFQFLSGGYLWEPLTEF